MPTGYFYAVLARKGIPQMKEARTSGQACPDVVQYDTRELRLG